MTWAVPGSHDGEEDPERPGCPPSSSTKSGCMWALPVPVPVPVPAQAPGLSLGMGMGMGMGIGWAGPGWRRISWEIFVGLDLAAVTKSEGR